MSIVVCGINHKTAPVALREKVTFSPDKLGLYLSNLANETKVKDAVILSTCNRSELYCVTDDVPTIREWFCRQHRATREALMAAMYIYDDTAAIEHIMNVACGLDSMILGESQILGQMKEAFSESVAAGVVSTTFNRLFQQVFMLAKEIRNTTSLGACPVSVSSAAVSFIRNKLAGSLHGSCILILGAGATIELVLRHVTPEFPLKIILSNRSLDNAYLLADKYKAEVIPLTQLAAVLPMIDIVITATGSMQPLITPDIISPRQKPIWMVDIAVPRDIDPKVGELNQVNLYSIDDLKTIIQHNWQGREHAADKARELIKKKSQDFVTWLHSLDLVATTITAYRRQVEELCCIELTKARLQLERGITPEEVLSQFAYALTNKLLHTPSVQLRQAGNEGRLEILHLAKELFAISELKPEII